MPLPIFESVFFCCTLQVSDLGNLIGLYSEWHSRLLPYYSFDQFVHKAEQVAATKRVKVRYSYCFYHYSYFVVEGISITLVGLSYIYYCFRFCF